MYKIIIHSPFRSGFRHSPFNCHRSYKQIRFDELIWTLSIKSTLSSGQRSDARGDADAVIAKTADHPTSRNDPFSTTLKVPINALSPFPSPLSHLMSTHRIIKLWQSLRQLEFILIVMMLPECHLQIKESIDKVLNL